MAGSGLKLWFIVGIVVTGVYVLPSVTAKFSGSHTMEFNASTATTKASMKCGQCHQYIVAELNATTLSKNVVQAHINATNRSRTNYTLWAFDYTVASNSTGAVDDVCSLCHYTNITIAGGHTKVYIRVCTDPKCHGNWTDAWAYDAYWSTDDQGSGAFNVSLDIDNDPAFSRKALNVSSRLKSVNDRHAGWFYAMGTKGANMTNEQGGNYTSDFYTCLGCHTHVGVDINVTRPAKFSINISVGTLPADYSMDAAPEANDSVKWSNSSAAAAGTKWN